MIELLIIIAIVLTIDLITSLVVSVATGKFEYLITLKAIKSLAVRSGLFHQKKNSIKKGTK